MSIMKTVEKLISVKHDEPEVAIRARAFNILIIGFWGLMLIITVIILIHWTLDPYCSYGATTVVALILVNIMLPASFAHSKLGYFRGAVWVFLSMLFIGSFIAQIGRGNSNAIILIYPIAVITAGLMLGLKSVLATLGISIFTFLSATKVIERYGPYLENDAGTMALNNAMAVIASLIVISLITWLFTRNTREYIKQLEISNREKEVLLKEIHHRVKNNLQMVSSLLNLQSDIVKDPEAKAAFRESVGRVKSMALVHEKIYISKDLSSIPVKSYLENLLEFIGRTHGVEAEIIIETDIDDAEMDIEPAITLGMILNELVSNAFKHAFANDERTIQKKVMVKFRKDNDRVELTVMDNGKGMSENSATVKIESLGLQLVSTMVKESSGTMEIDGGNGTEIRISMRLKGAADDKR